MLKTKSSTDFFIDEIVNFSSFNKEEEFKIIKKIKQTEMNLKKINYNFYIHLRKKNKTDYTLIKSEKEKNSINEILNRRKKLIELIINSNLKLILKLIISYYKLNFMEKTDKELLELVQISVESILENAFWKFNVSKNFRFMTYAQHWVKLALIQEKRKFTHITELPRVSFWINFKKINKIKKDNPDITDAEIKDKLSLYDKTLNLYNNLPSVINTTTYAYLTQEQVDENSILGSKCDNFENFELELYNLLKSSLKKIEVYVLIHRFGLFGEDKKTLEKIGLSLKKTRERIRQIQNKAIDKLKKSKKIEHFKNFLN